MILLQLAAVLAVCRLMTHVFARLRQPVVVAQIVAGVLIGPSVLGLVPAWQRFVFSPHSISTIQELGNVGLVLYMFGVGAELDLGGLRRNVRSAMAISVVSVVLPLAAGALLATWLVQDARLFPSGVSRPAAVGFFALAISITAFPVMARILTETGLLHSRVGTTSLAAGSFTDATAWCLLAVVTASLNGSAQGAAVTVVTGLALALLMLLARRTPLLARLLARGLEEWSGRPWLPPVVLPVLLAAAWASAAAGLHPAFGAFMVGVAMPRTEALFTIRRRMEPAVVVLLLPLFFVYSGLNTRIGLLLSGDLPLIAVLIVLVACLSKGVGCWLAAWRTGHSGREAVGIGALMNARGLVELVVLSVGLERGVITPALFSMMVVMAIATTMMAGPVVRALFPDVSAADGAAERAEAPVHEQGFARAGGSQ